MSGTLRGDADFLALGDWNAVCFRCGSKFKASTMLKNWQGFWTCSRCWEPRQPQDFVRGIVDVQTPPWVQPPPQDVFAAVCFPNGITAIDGYAVAGCAIATYVSPFFNPSVGV